MLFRSVGAASQKEMSQQDYELYGTYIPFSMAICHTINHKSGMDHTTYAHTGAMVNIYALGAGAEKFRGVFDNTEIYTLSLHDALPISVQTLPGREAAQAFLCSQVDGAAAAQHLGQQYKGRDAEAPTHHQQAEYYRAEVAPAFAGSGGKVEHLTPQQDEPRRR